MTISVNMPQARKKDSKTVQVREKEQLSKQFRHVADEPDLSWMHQRKKPIDADLNFSLGFSNTTIFFSIRDEVKIKKRETV